jgi:hypothetical protein
MQPGWVVTYGSCPSLDPSRYLPASRPGGASIQGERGASSCCPPLVTA